MRLPRKRDYKKVIDVPCKDGTFQPYDVKWVKRFKRKSTLAECDPGDHTITIKLGQSRAETFRCMIHELLHAIEFECEIDIPHKMIYALEEPLALLLLENF
jgi:hypothetical protein